MKSKKELIAGLIFFTTLTYSNEVVKSDYVAAPSQKGAVTLEEVLGRDKEKNSEDKDMENKNTTKEENIQEKSHTVEKKAAEYFRVYDPYEAFNKRMYKFNYHLDNMLIRPVTNSYKIIVPKFLQKNITNFFDNSQNFNTAVNALAQGEGKKFMRALARFSINSILGIGGSIDVATKLEMPHEYEDFGLTLNNYGIEQGPFLILPIFGPSNLRDAIGIGMDFQVRAFGHPYTATGLVNMNSMEVIGLYGIDMRKKVPFGYYDMGSPFEYEYIRYFYSEYRHLQEISTD